MYKGAGSSPLLDIPLGSSSKSGAEGCKGGPDPPPSLCACSNGSCGFSLQTCSPWGPLFARLKGGICTIASGTGLSFSAFPESGAPSASTRARWSSRGSPEREMGVSQGRPFQHLFLCEVLQNKCQHAWMTQGAWKIRGRQLQVKRKQRVTSASISSAPSNIELSGNKELGLHLRVIHAWLVGVKMSAAADLREETGCFCGQWWKVIRLGQWDSAGTAAVSSSCTQDGG